MEKKEKYQGDAKTLNRIRQSTHKTWQHKAVA